ncbi:MAG: SRPBCC family protein [Chloroflexi bacterium]|nr:SRPBCC family protein [Chloroflexota bacterium]
MTTLQRQIETRLSVERAFAYIADFANSMHWDPGVVASEAVDPTSVGLGSRYRLRVRLGGRTAAMEYSITSFDAPHVVVLTGKGSGVTAVDEIRFTPIAAGTRIDYTADITLGGVLRLAQPFLGGAFRKLADDALGGMRTKLDALADEQTTQPAPSVDGEDAPSVDGKDAQPAQPAPSIAVDPAP